MSNLLKTDQRHFSLKECVHEKKKRLEKKKKKKKSKKIKIEKQLDRTTQEVIQLKSVTDFAPTSHKYCFFLVNGSG